MSRWMNRGWVSERASEWAMEEGIEEEEEDNIDPNTCKHILLSVIQLFCWQWKRRRGSCIDQREESEFSHSVIVRPSQKKESFLWSHLHTVCLPLQRISSFKTICTNWKWNRTSILFVCWGQLRRLCLELEEPWCFTLVLKLHKDIFSSVSK